jgi:hypothetical protein
MNKKLERGCGPDWVCAPCNAVNFDIRRQCRFCRKQRTKVDAALAIEARRAATTKIDAVHESAGPQDNAQ